MQHEPRIPEPPAEAFRMGCWAIGMTAAAARSAWPAAPVPAAKADERRVAGEGRAALAPRWCRLFSRCPA